MQLLLQYVQPHTVQNITCARPLNVLKFSWTSAFLLPRALTDVLFLLFVPSALRGVQHVTICTFQFCRQELFVVHLLFSLSWNVFPWFWVRKIGMVWGPRGGGLRSADCLASFDQLHSCTALLLSLSLILQQLRLSCWLRKQERNCERL